MPYGPVLGPLHVEHWHMSQVVDQRKVSVRGCQRYAGREPVGVAAAKVRCALATHLLATANDPVTIEPLDGVEEMRRNRSLEHDAPPKLIAAGPGRLSQAFDILPEQDGQAIARGQPIALRHPPEQLAGVAFITCPRVGISKAVDRPYRFCALNSRYLSKPIPARLSTRPSTSS